ncbi:serine/threonine protein kinase [Aspergillus pseudonomiae]|nr:serine/threonine protein kinase [Aspergillus pseudonomiae]
MLQTPFSTLGLLKGEKTVFRLLIEHPHPNIIEAIDIGHPEGIYLRKYQPLSGVLPSTQPDRIAWYQDIMRALVHLHRFGIAHSDLRKDNILSDQKDHALLGDFSASCPFGHPNPSRPVLLNGPSETISDATDRFAMGSLIYELETGVRPEISVDNPCSLSLPLVHTGCDELDSIIDNAWRGQYQSTADMLKHIELLNAGQDSRGPVEYTVSKEELIGRINQWRRRRVEKHGSVVNNQTPTKRTNKTSQAASSIRYQTRLK